MTLTALSLKGRALRYLAAREHSRAELERKLQSFEEAPGDLARVLDELQAKGFINEQRVVESVVHRRASRLGSRRASARNCRAKGWTANRADGGRAAAGHGAWACARGLAQEVPRTRTDTASRAKQMRFLASRGFGADAIRRVVSGADDEEIERHDCRITPCGQRG